MAEVSIDIAAMADLVSSLGKAKGTITRALGALRGNLSGVMLSTSSLERAKGIEGEIDTALRDLNRRLALARLIQQSTPGIAVVRFDDSVLSNASPAEVKRRVERVLELLKVDGDGSDPIDVDQELVDLLDQNALDPYFAQALASQLSPDELNRYLRGVNRQRLDLLNDDDGGLDDFDKRYSALLGGLGETLGLASRGTGDLAVPGMSKVWRDWVEDTGKGDPAAVNRVSLLWSRGQWSDDMMKELYRGVREVEDDDGDGFWKRLSEGDLAMDPDISDDEMNLVVDPMTNLFRGLANNPGAVRDLFTGGDMTSVNTKTACVQVNAELYDLLRNRGMREETADAFMAALGAAVASPPVPGQSAFQPLLANDLKSIGEALQEEARKAEEDAGPLWERIGHGLLDLVGLIPVVGEPADFLNGVWYYASGDVINGSLSMGSVIPFAGYAAVGGKWVRRGLDAAELARLTKLAKQGKNIRLFDDAGTVLRNVDLKNPANFAPEKFLSPAELRRWSGKRQFMQRVIAGNRFNSFLNPRYAYSEVPLTTGNKAPFRLDSYTPGRAIVSRKLTQLGTGGVSARTAKGYIDEFAKKYPAGTRIADTPATRQAGIAGQRIRGRMELQVPPQSGPIDPEILTYAQSKNIRIVDINGLDYTKDAFEAAAKGR